MDVLNIARTMNPTGRTALCDLPNIVVNGDFEQGTAVVSNPAPISYATGWNRGCSTPLTGGQFSASPDVYDANLPSSFVPLSGLVDINAAQGNHRFAYIGQTFILRDGKFEELFDEHIDGQLVDYLPAGCYKLRFYASTTASNDQQNLAGGSGPQIEVRLMEGVGNQINCSSSKLIFTSSPMPMAPGWVQMDADFTIEPNESGQYNRVELRIRLVAGPSPHVSGASSRGVFIDEVSITCLPGVDAGPDRQVCYGESVVLTAQGGGGSYQWYSSQTGQAIIGSGPSITVSPWTATTYTVVSTDGNCTSSDSVTVHVIPSPILGAPQLSTIDVCAGDFPMTLDALPINTQVISSYQWYEFNGSTGFVPIPGAVSPTLEVHAPGIYCMQAWANRICNRHVCFIVQLTPPLKLDPDFGILTWAPAGNPNYIVHVNPINTQWNNVGHGYYISEVDANGNFIQAVGISWGNNGGGQWLSNPPFGLILFERGRYYEIKHGIWNSCEWIEKRRYIYID